MEWEIKAIINYRLSHLDEGYRRLTYMMLDANVVAVSPSSVYRVLKRAGLLFTQWRHQKAKGTGFVQPLTANEHWHLDISYINFKGTFVYLMVLIDGFSRYIVYYELKLSIEALDVEIMLQRAMLKFPGAKPVLITDNGPQFIAKELKIFFNEVGLLHRRTRFFYPQSNGKVERFMETIKNEAVRKQSYINLEDLRSQIEHYITDYNENRLHSAIGYITPKDMMNGKKNVILVQRTEKLKLASENRRSFWEQNNQPTVSLGGLKYA